MVFLHPFSLIDTSPFFFDQILFLLRLLDHSEPLSVSGCKSSLIRHTAFSSLAFAPFYLLGLIRAFFLFV